MPSKVNPNIPITLDKERHLRFDLNAMASFQEVTGKNLFDGKVRVEMAQAMNPKDLRALLWACLIHEDEKLTLKQVGALISPDNMAAIIRQLGEAQSAAEPDATEVKTEGSPLASPPNG